MEKQPSRYGRKLMNQGKSTEGCKKFPSDSSHNGNFLIFAIFSPKGSSSAGLYSVFFIIFFL